MVGRENPAKVTTSRMPDSLSTTGIKAIVFYDHTYMVLDLQRFPLSIDYSGVANPSKRMAVSCSLHSVQSSFELAYHVPKCSKGEKPYAIFMGVRSVHMRNLLF